ncbi:hypothetical protein [Levilactobacillus spicheri]|uniref:Uncharacterized protein n=2 Tax=Levilactobacillus spicheri TaxID=216463 RepID=A0A0F3RU92_9LACO|nr:hypothetical protein [Levilactobacillus spicheri]KJW13179.1 hypothetical protein VC81_04030 [Levilactobacillus spicheri]KRL47534.1 hypothetical protein FD37_GL002404 [Levilactobacillus spicheri DSM 15429]GEO68018.1 hypothetical protein LSP04_24370 [Levilactobacillus spicheri]
MADSALTITDLDEGAQDTALTEFAHFYLKHYRTNDLEILSDYRVDYSMNDINTYLFENRFFSPEELIAGVLKYKRPLFMNILKTVGLPYNANGSLQDITWEGWYAQRYAQINQGL